MKVNAWKNLDVEVEVDVSLDDCISEMLNISDSDDGPRRKLSAIDGATKVLERITPEMVATILDRNPGAVQTLRFRLQKWVERTK